MRGFQEDGSVSRAWESELVEEDCGRGGGGAGDGVGCGVKKWEEDLGASREVSDGERERVRFVVGWFLDWAGKMGVEGTVDDGRRFWREVVLGKKREAWKLEEWAAGLRWLWRWRELGGCEDAAGPGRLVERVKRAVWTTGARRGLALRTRETYAGWCGRFADWCGEEREVMRDERARVWLGELVSNQAVAYATQKQALNALVFFSARCAVGRKWIWGYGCARRRRGFRWCWSGQRWASCSSSLTATGG